jgi:hypothetical protein
MGGYDMAFRLWLRLSKLFVALSTAAERITTAVQDRRTPPQRPPTRQP